MSHVAEIKMEINDLSCLAKAAKKLGMEFVEGQLSYRWYGRSVGDYPLPAGFKASDLGRCEHALRIPGNNLAYEIGVVRRRDGKPGYTLLWDFWNHGFGLEDKVGPEANRLKQEYSIAVATKQAMKQGYRLQRFEKPDGSVVLKASK